jgi:hypothetical protein
MGANAAVVSPNVARMLVAFVDHFQFCGGQPLRQAFSQ